MQLRGIMSSDRGRFDGLCLDLGLSPCGRQGGLVLCLGLGLGLDDMTKNVSCDIT